MYMLCKYFLIEQVKLKNKSYLDGKHVAKAFSVQQRLSDVDSVELM